MTLPFSPLLPAIVHSSLDYATIGPFLSELFSTHNLFAVFMKFAIFIPILLILLLINLIRNKQNKLPLTKAKRLLLCLYLSLFSFGMPNSKAFAHPMGNFSVNCYSKLQPYAEKLDVQYVLDMAEIPTVQERKIIDINQDSIVDNKEQISYLEKKSEQLARGLKLIINNKPIELKILSKNIKFLPGQGGLSTLRLEMQLEAFFKSKNVLSIEYTDDNYHERPGWKEIIANPSPGIKIEKSNVSEKDLTNALTSYPENLMYKLLGEVTAHIVAVSSAGATNVIKTNQTQRSATARKDNRFTQLIKSRTLTPGIVLIALIASIGLGAFHAMSPGHGKSIVAAYLVGSNGTVKHAMFLGGTVTLTHTFGVFVLGLITLFADGYILPDQLFPWISIVSGAIVFIMGAVMLIARIRRAFHSTGYNHHQHLHENSHHNIDCLENNNEHQHEYDLLNHHDHDHNHDHDHHNHDHHHGHSHMIPANDRSPVTWRQLSALGISGGILPCPSALVVLLAAISLHRIGFGLLLIISFSLGLASALTGVGILFVKARQFLDKVQTTGPVLKLLPALSALVIMILGIGIMVDTLTQVV